MERPTVKTQPAIAELRVMETRPGGERAALLSPLDAESFPSRRACSLCKSRSTFFRYKVFPRDSDGGGGCCLRCFADLLMGLERRAIAVDRYGKVETGVLRSRGPQR